MKRKLIIAVLIAIAVPLTGQEWQKEDVVGFLSFAPEDRSIWLRFDIAGGYVAYSLGNYRMPDKGMIQDHQRVAVGLTHKQFTFGVVYHNNGEISTDIELPKAVTRPISIEAGVRIKLDRFVAALRFDPLRWEGVLDFGITF